MNKWTLRGFCLSTFFLSSHAMAYYHVATNSYPDSKPQDKYLLPSASTPAQYQASDLLLMGSSSNYMWFHVDANHNLFGTPYQGGKAGKPIQLSVEGLPLSFSAVSVERGQSPSTGKMVAALTNQGVLLYLAFTTCREQKYKLFTYPAGVSQSDIASIKFASTDNQGVAYIALLTKAGRAFVYKLNPKLDACFDPDFTHRVYPVTLPNNDYGSYQPTSFYIDGHGSFYVGTDNGLYQSKDTGAALGFQLADWHYSNKFVGNSVARIGQVSGGTQNNTCVFSSMGAMYCLDDRGKWFNPASSAQLGAYNFYRYTLSKDANSTDTIDISLQPNGETFTKPPYVKITYIGNTGKVIKTDQQTLSTTTPLQLKIMEAFRGFNTPAIEDPYWYKMHVGQVQLNFYNGANNTQFGTMQYGVMLDTSSVYQMNQLGAIYLQQEDFGITHGWKLNTHLQSDASQNIQVIALTAPADKTAFSKHAANVGRDFNLDIHFDGSQSGQVLKLYSNGRQQIPLYVTVCPIHKNDPAITDAQLAQIKQYLTINNQNTLSPLGYHVDANGGSYTALYNDHYKPGMFNGPSIYQGYANGPLTTGNCANMAGAKVFVEYVSAKQATNSLPVYATTLYLDQYGNVKTESTQGSTANRLQVVTPNYHYQDANFAPTECKYIDDADALHAKYTCQATVKNAGNLPDIDHMTYNKIYQLDNQNNQVVRLLEPDVDIASHNLLTMSFYKPYYPTDHVGTNVYMDARGVDQYGNEVSVSMKPSLNHQKSQPDKVVVGMIMPEDLGLVSHQSSVTPKLFSDNYAYMDYTDMYPGLVERRLGPCSAGLCQFRFANIFNFNFGDADFWFRITYSGLSYKFISASSINTKSQNLSSSLSSDALVSGSFYNDSPSGTALPMLLYLNQHEKD